MDETQKIQQAVLIGNIILCSMVYFTFGAMAVLSAIDYRRSNKIKPMKGWRAVLIFLFWPVWFIVWLTLQIIISFWRFLWSDVK